MFLEKKQSALLLILALFASALLAADPHKVLVLGHRGARALRPENTIPSFKYTIAAGADALELDVAVTKDNVAVVSHDPTLHPPICAGDKPEAVIRELTLAQMRQWDCGATRNPGFPRQEPVPGTRIPTLDEVLDLASLGDFDFYVETKISKNRPELTPSPEEFARLVLNAVRERHLEKRVILHSFDFDTLRAMKKLAPEIRLSALFSGAPRDFVAVAREAGASIVSPEQSLVTEAQVRAAHEAGLKVLPWTANTPEEWDRLISAGADGIITDDSAALLDHLKKRGLH